MEVCEVKEILAKRVQEDGQVEYLVSWVQYPGGDTWEPIENLENVPEKIEKFEAK